MILEDDWNVRLDCSQRQHLLRKVETMHMKHIRRQTALQFAERRVSVLRRCAAERQKVVFNAVALQTLRKRAGLHHRHANAGAGSGFGDIDERWPGFQQLCRRPSLRVVEKPDLDDVKRPARQHHKLMTRGSHWRMSLRETRSSQGSSYRWNR